MYCYCCQRQIRWPKCEWAALSAWAKIRYAAHQMLYHCMPSWSCMNLYKPLNKSSFCQPQEPNWELRSVEHPNVSPYRLALFYHAMVLIFSTHTNHWSTSLFGSPWSPIVNQEVYGERAACCKGALQGCGGSGGEYHCDCVQEGDGGRLGEMRSFWNLRCVFGGRTVTQHVWVHIAG